MIGKSMKLYLMRSEAAKGCQISTHLVWVVGDRNSGHWLDALRHGMHIPILIEQSEAGLQGKTP